MIDVPPLPDRSPVSVILPTYNRAHYLREAIDSVLRQDHPSLELIVVDDGSTDVTPSVLEGYGAQLTTLRQANRGVGAARNAGVARARGALVAFLDDDDLWEPDKLSLQVKFLAAHPATDVVYGHMRQFASPELADEVRARFRHLDGQVLPSPLPSSMLIRRTAFERVGPFDETLQIGVDMDWHARMQDAGLSMTMLDDVVYRRRLHPGGMNASRPHEQHERVQVLRRVLARRRAAASAILPSAGAPADNRQTPPDPRSRP
ncbi:MAG: glycosyltransferase family 2 protein [Alphaproteobacteria bacterium]